MKSILGGGHALFVFVFVLVLFACEADVPIAEEPSETSYEGVDERLWEYFDRFETEGQNRGYSIDIRSLGITAEIEDIEEEHVAGLCNFNFRSPNHIIIDARFWRETPPQYLEMIIFHELGHCYLNQGHREGVLDRNVCASIMRSGIEDCVDNYQADTRSYYLDELFGFEEG